DGLGGEAGPLGERLLAEARVLPAAPQHLAKGQRTHLSAASRAGPVTHAGSAGPSYHARQGAQANCPDHNEPRAVIGNLALPRWSVEPDTAICVSGSSGRAAPAPGWSCSTAGCLQPPLHNHLATQDARLGGQLGAPPLQPVVQRRNPGGGP